MTSHDLNYLHLQKFWVVARTGGLRAAAQKLNISQPSISAQISALEGALGEKLFRRQGRANVLTDAGQIVLRYADEIFALGQELTKAISQRPSCEALRLHVGVADALPKLVTNEILRPVFSLPQSVHVICSEGKLEDLLGKLSAHRLDIVLADEPVSSSHHVRAFTHKLGDSGTTFCAEPTLARRLKRGFPYSLQGAPALLPSESTSLRRSLESWFKEINIRPQVIADFEDAALMKVVATEGRGFIALPSVVAEEAALRYDLQPIGTTERCRDAFFAITTERRIHHPALSAITDSARLLFGS